MRILHTHTHAYSLSLVRCYDEIEGTQDQDFPCSSSVFLSLFLSGSGLGFLSLRVGSHKGKNRVLAGTPFTCTQPSAFVSP